MGAVELTTRDLPGLTQFYTEGVGLTTLFESPDEVALGLDDAELLHLVMPAADVPADDTTQAGLYHSAFLYPDEFELASANLCTADVAPSTFQGASDHSVSEAFYFSDPDGNGVELYLDHPADTWEWSDGEVTMGSAALDPNAFIGEALGDRVPSPRAEAVSMGHAHLRGGDLGEARQFYGDALGFAVTS